MTRYPRTKQLLAVGLAAIAGYVDASGFIALGGFFISFMSGNSTRLGLGIVQNAAEMRLAAALIGLFVAGVVAGALVAHRAEKFRKPVILSLVALMLAVAATMDAAGSVLAACFVMAVTMGLMNNVFERDGEVSIGLTYMTGSLVKLGQRIAAALRGGDPLGWLPYLWLWGGFVSGAIAGALAHAQVGLVGLWGVAALSAVLAAVAASLV